MSGSKVLALSPLLVFRLRAKNQQQKEAEYRSAEG
jgi:hypothetical protein